MARLSTNPEVVLTELEEGAVLLNLETRTYYSLNAAGLRAWRAIDSNDDDNPLGAAAEALELEPERARAAAGVFIGELEREDLVVGEAGSETESAARARPAADGEPSAAEPQLVKHDEPLHEITKDPFDPQLPLAE